MYPYRLPARRNTACALLLFALVFFAMSRFDGLRMERNSLGRAPSSEGRWELELVDGTILIPHSRVFSPPFTRPVGYGMAGVNHAMLRVWAMAFAASSIGCLRAAMDGSKLAGPCHGDLLVVLSLFRSSVLVLASNGYAE